MESILLAFNEINNTDYKSIQEVINDCWSYKEIIDAALTYEGFIYYTDWILNLISNFYTLEPIAKEEI